MESTKKSLTMSANGIKRTLPNDFDICGEPEIIEQLGHRLIEAAGSMKARDFTYGWVHVQLFMSLAEGTPREWHE